MSTSISFADINSQAAVGYIFEDFVTDVSKTTTVTVTSDEYLNALLNDGKEFEVIDKYYQSVPKSSSFNSIQTEYFDNKEYVLVDTIKTLNSIPNSQ